MPITSDTRAPNPVDVHVGARVRLRRKLMGISQEQLANALGRTFQQVQKYENGSNRVSASKLYAIATTLAVPVSFFFEGLVAPGVGDPAPDESEGQVLAFLGTPEGLELAQLFPQIRRGPVRRQVMDLVRTMAS